MPFTEIQFYDLFARYNEAIWPLQVGMYGLGVTAMGLLLWHSPAAGWLMSLALAVMWAVTGIGYHWMFFTTINPLAPAFAGLFLLQAALLVVAPAIWRDWRFAPSDDARSWAGAGLALFAMAIYPI
jgi:hypothetical protein